MITVKKINGKEIVINCELIESIEGGADTVIALTTHSKFVVMDRPEDIVDKVIAYHQATNCSNIDVHMHAATNDAAEEDEVEAIETVSE